jgi:hypothetical protein
MEIFVGLAIAAFIWVGVGPGGNCKVPTAR